MNKLLSFLGKKTGSIILGIYLGIVVSIHLFMLLPSGFFSSFSTKIGFLIIILTTFVISFFISDFIIRRLRKICVKITLRQSITHKKHYKVFLLFLAVSLAISLVWFVAYAPGGFSPDSIGQYNQALTNNYSDWHPVLHTLIFFKIPMSIFNNNASAIVICQIILFCIVVSYSLTTIYEIAGKKWGIVASLIILANPMVMDELMSPWKDVAFAIFALFATTAALKIYASSGTWGNKNSRIILLAIVLSCATIFRHNAILFTLPLIVGLFFFLKRTQWIKLVFLMLAVIFLIKVPLYSVLHVSSPDRRTSETAGISLTIIGNTIKKTPNLLDEEIINFAHDITSQENWEKKYTTGDFNSIKWQSNLSRVEDAGVFKTTELAIRAITQSPSAGLGGLFGATQVVYGLEQNDNNYTVIPSVTENDFSINYSGNQFIKTFTDLYRNAFNNSILHYFSLVGTTIIVILAFILSHTQWKKNNWKKILLCLPILFYDFGTMILLSGPETRFFYINFLVYPIIVIFSILHHDDNHQPRNKKGKTKPVPHP